MIYDGDLEVKLTKNQFQTDWSRLITASKWMHPTWYDDKQRETNIVSSSYLS